MSCYHSSPIRIDRQTDKYFYYPLGNSGRLKHLRHLKLIIGQQTGADLDLTLI